MNKDDYDIEILHWFNSR